MPSDRVSFLLHDQAQLEAAHSSLRSEINSIAIVLAHPCLVRDHNATLQSFLADVNALPALKEVKLSLRGAGKRTVIEIEDQNNTLKADDIAALISSLSSLKSLELVTSKLEGPLDKLAAALQHSNIARVVVHQCDSDTLQGFLPVIDGLSQNASLKTLIIEAAKFPLGDMTANTLLKLAESNLERLELCLNLGDEELAPLMGAIKTLKHLRVSLFSFKHPPRQIQWGNRVIEALAKSLRSPESSLISLALTATSTTTSPLSSSSFSVEPLLAW